MKTQTSLFFHAFLACSLLAISCKKEVTAEKPLQEGNTIKTPDAVINQLPGIENSKRHVLFSGGEYISTYGDGITFGTSLPHPTDDPTGVYDGYPIPTIGSVNWIGGSWVCPGTWSEGYFSILVPTFPASGVISAEANIDAFHDFQHEIFKINTDPNLNILQKELKIEALPEPERIVKVEQGDMIRVAGLLIRDHTSPTGMSVIDEKYITPPVEGSLKTVGFAIKGVYRCTMKAPTSSTSGPVTSVKVTNGGVTVPLERYSLTYSGNIDIGFHTIGTITLASGLVLNIDDYLYP